MKGDDTMAVVAVVGLQWGDEGKGKIIDLLAKRKTKGMEKPPNEAE